MRKFNLYSQLVRLLEDETIGVIALTGEWGVGKTYLWEQIQSEIDSLTQNQNLRNQVKDAVYASLFGVPDKKEIETRLMVSIVSKEAAQNPSKQWAKPLKKLYFEVEKRLSEEYRIGKLIGSLLEPVLFSRVVDGRLVVLDDIERKSQELKADELLGFVENLSRVHKCKVLLILSNENLTEECSKIWNTLKEKVIHTELKIKQSSEDAFEIALKKQKWDYINDENKDWIKLTLSIIGINNIRAIQKILRKINYLLSYVDVNKQTYLDGKIKAFTVITAAYYRLLKHNVIWEDFKNFNQYDFETNNSTEKGRWMTYLVNSLGLNIGEAFNELYFDFVNTGFVDEDRLMHLMKGFEKESKEAYLNQMVRQLTWDLYWNPNKSNDDFDSELIKIIAQLCEPNARIWETEFSQLIEAIDKNLPNSNGRKQTLIDKWLQDLESRCQKEGAKALDNLICNDRILYLKSQIEKELNRLSNKYKEPVDVEEICLKLRQNRGWNNIDESDLNSLTVDEFKRLIYDTENENWWVIMLELSKLKTYFPHFEIASDKFRCACEDVLSQSENENVLRLRTVLKRIMGSV